MAMIPWWLAFASAQEPAQHAPTHGPFEIVRTWTGGELDHLGIGMSALGDVNGDGVPDFILGTMKGAYMFYFGPGSARVVSGKDGAILYTVRGTEGTLDSGDVASDCGDAFGDTIAAIGDVDGDGVADFAVGAWRYGGYRGFATVYSGRSGLPLATIYRDGRIDRGRAADRATGCEIDFQPGIGGSIVALSDIDEDGVPDFAVGGCGIGDVVYLVSGRRLEILARMRGKAIAQTGDVDGDGSSDILCWDGRLELWSRTGTKLGDVPLEEGERFDVVGDLDADGFVDLFTWRLSKDGRTRSRTVSGRSGETIGRCDIRLSVFEDYTNAGSLGDLDGDGTADFFVRGFVHGTRGRVWWISIVSGRTAQTLVVGEGRGSVFGRSIVPLGDIDGDGRAEFLLSDHESPAGARCGGAVHLVRLREGWK